jgi:hypothetical protein
VAAHLAAAALSSQECASALAAGINALLGSKTSVKISALQVNEWLSGGGEEGGFGRWVQESLWLACFVSTDGGCCFVGAAWLPDVDVH